ncbi:MAG: DUF1349 domain-containing protein, partial [Oscillospiraceae bacterium]|nr:DUF1349 domain-containing protein [Oscillospiraceae bacterium]
MKKNPNKLRIKAVLFAVVLAFSTLYPGAVVSAEPSSTVINVVDYGADPAGVTDSAAPVWQAILAAKEVTGPVTIYFPKGEYHFWEEYAVKRDLYISNTDSVNQSYKTKNIGILIEDMKDVTVDGGGSLFMYHGNMMILAAIRSENVTFTNFSEDFYSPSVVDVTVEEKGSNYSVLYIPECYDYTISGTSITWNSDKSPVTGRPYWTGSNMMNSQIYDTKTGRTWRGGPNPFSSVRSIEDLGNNRVKLTYTSGSGASEVGYVHQMRYTTARPTSATLFWESKNTTLKDVKMHFLHSFGMVSQLTENVTIENVSFSARPGTGRVTASGADFIQMSGVRGNVRIRGCDFYNPQDDPINIHAYYLPITAIDGATYTVMSQHSESHGFPKFYAGDEVEFISIATGQPAGRATIVSAVGPTDESAAARQTIRLTFAEPIPGVTVGAYNIENVTYMPDVEITGNRMAHVPTRGILCTTRGPVLIENNYFDNMTMATIALYGELTGSYRESGAVHDMTIRGNTFDRPYAESILISPTVSSSLAGQGIYYHNNIVIEDNVFNLEGGATMLQASETGGLVFRGNTVNRYAPGVSLSISAPQTSLTAGESTVLAQTSGGASLGASLFNFSNRCSVTLQDNIYDNGLNLRADNIGAGNITILGDDVRLGQNNNRPAVGDVLYASTDESVAVVDASGRVTAKGAGAADIYAYTVAGARTFLSNKITFTVTGDPVPTPDAPESISISAPSYFVEKPTATLAFSAQVLPSAADQGLTWSVRDAATKQPTAKASVSQDGLLTALEPAVVEVLAHSTADNSLYDAKLVTIQSVADTLSPVWRIREPNPAKYSIGGDAVTITSNGGGIYNSGNSMPNVFITDIPAGVAGNFTAQVKMTGKPSAGYQEAGIMFLKDLNNYVSALRKYQGGAPRVGAISETNGAGNEEQYSNDSFGDEMYLRITKLGDVYTSEYSADGSEWNTMGTTGQYTNTALGSGFQIGFYAGNTAGAPVRFEEYKVNGVLIPFTWQANAPGATDAEITADDLTLTLGYAYTSPDAAAEGVSLYRWYASTAPTGPFQPVETATTGAVAVTSALSGKYVKAAVVPVDSAGRTGAPVQSAAVQVLPGTDGGADLVSLTVTGAKLDPAFSADIMLYSALVPPLTSQFVIEAEASAP